MAKKNEKTTKIKQVKKYSLNELADLFGVTISKMRSMYAVRGIEKNQELTRKEAFDKFKNIV